MAEAGVQYSVVIPVYNEEESLDVLFREVHPVMSALPGRYELILVNDCSNDQTGPILKRLAQENPDIVRVIDLPQRSGQTRAMRVGIDAAKGELIITLDADLQNDPADIPRMLEKMKEDKCHMVCGWRKTRRDTFLKARLSKTGNVLQRTFTGMKIHDISCTLRIFTKETGQKIALNWEGQHRFIPLSASLQGCQVSEIISNHRDRRFGCTKYGHKRIFRVMVDFVRILAVRGRR